MNRNAQKIQRDRWTFTVRRTAAAAAVAACFSSLALANPTNPAVVHGTASFAAAGNVLNVTNSPNAIINWGSFSISVNELTRFIQPSALSAVLNRVIGQDPSAILGALQSNGRVFLINPNGIVFGAGSQINVAGLVASTLNLSNEDFLNNRMKFTDGAGAGSVVNQGTINAATGGSVYLVGKAVTNNGIITSPQGEVILAAGNSVELVNPGTPNLRVEIVAPDTEARNLGAITADAGRIGIYAGLINNAGTLRADSAQVTDDGRIVLKATKLANLEAGSTISASGAKGGSIEIQADVVVNTGSIHADGAQGGSVAVQARNVLSAGRISADGAQGAGGEVNVQASGRILQTAAAHLSADGATGGGKVTLQATDRVFGSGTLTAIGQGAGSTGGEIKVLANDIVLLGANLDASGDSGGGSVLVGGDFQGNNPTVQNAATNWINFSTTINADARTAGDGGKVIVWSDQETQFYGSISARGGKLSGDGGFIEVSGKENLVFGGMADAGAPNGKPGTLLLDPKFIVIDSAGGGGGLSSFLLVDPNLGAGDGFAQQVLVLANDNVVATDPNDDFVAANAGAVYLFNGNTGALISTLAGSVTDSKVGSGGVTALSNGNYVVISPLWDGAAADVGAVTWGNGVTGISGTAAAANSLIGSTAGDQVGNNGVTALSNGNYVVKSFLWDGAAADVGAVTWGDGSTAGTRLVGAVSAANSLVGSTSSDVVGGGGVTALTNGNYVVSSPLWGVSNLGAVTWGDGAGGTVGLVSAANSLVGSAVSDVVGGGAGNGGGVTALTNGNYVVASPDWGGLDVGAVTWGDGSTAGTRLVGAVSAANSLVGTTAFDQISGRAGGGINGVTALSNGNYVVRSERWDGTAANVGAVTWGNGAGGTVGPVSATNSLVGSTLDDSVGFGGVTALTNGNYVVINPSWTGAAAFVGAVTWGDGSTAGTRLVGAVTAANSLIGSTAFDQVGSGGVTALTNGNYVVKSLLWDGAAANVGSVTWGNGAGGTVGLVSAANSLIGSTANDQIGGGFGGGVTALTNGNYVVISPLWDGAVADVGAVTWGNGAGGTVGAVTAANSLVGSTANDQVGNGGVANGGVTVLTNGNYVVNSPFWDGAAADVGAVTWSDGSTAGTRLVGAVSAANSLVGTTAFDQVGSGGIFSLNNGNYVVVSNAWDSAEVNVGAITWGNGSVAGARLVGEVSAINSLVGTIAGDQIGSGGIFPLSNGNFVARSPIADNGVIVNAGLVHVLSPGGGAFSNPLLFADNAAGTTTITPAQITAITNTGTAVVLQANTDITLAAASDIISNNPAGNGGAITMQAGRSVLLNSNITTDNGNLTIVANERTANGVVDANRDAGTATITMAAGTTINAGSGNISVTLNDGAGLTNSTSGDITLANLTTGGHVLVRNIGPTAGSGIVRADATSLITASSAALAANGAGGGGEIGASTAPIRVSVTNLEASSQAGGAFFDSPAQGLTIGAAALGGLTAIQTLLTGAISVSASGTIAVTEGMNASGGSIALNANGALSDISFSGSGGVNTSGGSITLSAGRDIVHSGGAQQINTSSGAILLDAGRDILHTGAGTGQINTSSGAMTLMAGQDIIHSAGANQINTSSGAMLLSAGRDIVHSGAASKINNSSGSLTLTAGQDFIHSASGQVNSGSGAMTINVGRDFLHSATGSVNTSSGAMMTINVGRDFLYSGSGQVNGAVQTIAVTRDLTLSGALPVIRGSSGQTITVGNDLTLVNGGRIENFGTQQSITVGNNATLMGTGTGIASSINSFGSSSQSLTVGGNLLLTGNTAAAEIRANSATSNISVGGNVILTGGNISGAFARIFGNPDVVMTVGGVIQMNANAASASIAAASPTSVYITFPNLASGGYFVNGVEGVVYNAATGTGFVAGTAPAILNSNLLITYGLTAGGGALAGALLEVPTQTLIVATGESITPPEPEKDKDIFEDIKGDKKDKPPLCK